MVNLTYPELAETRAPSLPNASLEALRDLRGELCSQSASRDFKLQSHQRFLRRVLSPDSPVRNLLMVHGTGTGKTCTAIQIAEEYILRPEFQDKRVLVLANPAIQENFKKEIFDIQRAVVDKDGLLLSKQCTGRRYLEILQRVQSEPEQWTDKSVREQLKRLADKVLQEFYEFRGYAELANEVESKQLNSTTAEVDAWIHKHFDDRLVIIDEAHNLKVQSISETTTKKASASIERIIKVAKNMTLVLLTATPMYDTYDEIIYYFNLFLWNDRRQPTKKAVTVAEIFQADGSFQPGKEEVFRGWCQDYISFLKGDNPFTFPFRLPPPPELVAKPDRRDTKNRAIPAEEQRKYLVLTQSIVQGVQEEALQNETNIPQERMDAICVLPERKSFRESFQAFSMTDEALFEYRGPKFLAPSQVANYSSKFALIQKIIQESKGIVFVYSNFVEQGTNLFAMCLEEHGFEPAIGRRMLKTTAEEVPRGSRGKYILASDLSEMELRRGLEMLRARTNLNGDEIRVIVASPKISEGVDLKYVRQVHILDPWDNMSRIEQIIGRGIRTCSHALLPFEEQNCTVYLHVSRFAKSTKEIRDEYVYRAFVEGKAIKIAKVKQIIQESAMDCPLQNDVNSLPEDWRKLSIAQRRSQGNQEVTLTLEQLAAPNFGAEPATLTCKVTESIPDPNHERPLSAYLDVRDELRDKFLALFEKKPVWTKEDLLKHPKIRGYDPEVVTFLLQDAIETGFALKNAEGELGHLESRGDLYAFAKGYHDTLQDRTLANQEGYEVPLRFATPEEKEVEVIDLESIRKKYDWKGNAKAVFSPEVLDWYIVDQVLTPEQRTNYLLNLDYTAPPIYATRIKVGDLYNLGDSNIYDAEKEPITPIGKEKDALDAWVSDLKKRYLAQKTNVFGTMKGELLVFNLDHETSEIKIAERTKDISGRACRSYKAPLMDTFSEWLGKPVPNGMTKEGRCQWLGLLFRDAVMKKKEGITWWTPEEWTYLTRRDVSAELRGKK